MVAQALALNKHERPKWMEPKSGREELFAEKSWEELQASNNPVLELAREFYGVFLYTTPEVLPADKSVRQEIYLVLGSKYCVTRQ